MLIRLFNEWNSNVARRPSKSGLLAGTFKNLPLELKIPFTCGVENFNGSGITSGIVVFEYDASTSGVSSDFGGWVLGVRSYSGLTTGVIRRLFWLWSGGCRISLMLGTPLVLFTLDGGLAGSVGSKWPYIV